MSLMRKSKRSRTRTVKQTILISVLLCSGFMPAGSAAAASQKPAGKQSTAWELIRKSRQKQLEQKPAINIKVSELLNKYTENQDKLKSFICKWEASTQMDALLTEPPYNALLGKSQEVKLTEFCCDGIRYSEKFQTWGNIRSVKDFVRNVERISISLLVNA